MLSSLYILIHGKNIDVTILRRRSKVIENQFHRWLNSIFLVWLSGLLNLKDSYLVFNVLFTQSFEEFYKLIDKLLFCFSLQTSSIRHRICKINFELLAWCTKAVKFRWCSLIILICNIHLHSIRTIYYSKW